MLRRWVYLFFFINLVFVKPLGAEVLFEPSIGYSYGSQSSEFDGFTNLSASPTAHGPAFGAKFGVDVDDVFLGLDSKLNYYLIDDESGFGMSLGIGLGATFTFLPIRYYIAADIMNIQPISVATDEDTDGKKTFEVANMSSFGYRFGLGYYFNLKTIINFEVQIGNFEEDITDPNSTDKASVNAKFTAYTINISFPMTFDYPKIPWRVRYQE